MKISKLLALGALAAAGYYYYRNLVKSQGRAASQWAEQPSPEIESNPVDEALWESFPASDPPSFNSKRTVAS